MRGLGGGISGEGAVTQMLWLLPSSGNCSEVGSNPVRASPAHHNSLCIWDCLLIAVPRSPLALPVDAGTAPATDVASYPLFEERGVSFQELNQESKHSVQ